MTERMKLIFVDSVVHREPSLLGAAILVVVLMCSLLAGIGWALTMEMRRADRLRYIPDERMDNICTRFVVHVMRRDAG